MVGRAAVGLEVRAQHHGVGGPCEGDSFHGLLSKRIPAVSARAMFPFVLLILQSVHVCSKHPVDVLCLAAGLAAARITHPKYGI